MKRKSWTVYLLVFVLAAAFTVPSFVSLADETSLAGRTMSVLKVDGEQAWVNRSGMKELTAFDGMALGQGDSVSTGMETGLYIQADGDKTVKMDQNSIVEITKVSSKKLKLELKSGELFFHVENHLADDETLEIDAAGTTLSIRGTAGLFGCHGDQVTLYLLEGTVVWTVDGKPVTITAGQRMTATVKRQEGRQGASAGRVTEFTAADLNSFELEAVLERLDKLEIPASVDLEAAQKDGRLGRRVSDLRRTEREAQERTAAAIAMAAASMPHTEPGSGSYEIIHDEVDHDGIELSGTPEETKEPDETEEAEPPRTAVDFSMEPAMDSPFEACVKISKVTKVPDGEAIYARIIMFDKKRGYTFDSAEEMMNARGIFAAVIDAELSYGSETERGEMVIVTNPLRDLGLLKGTDIQIYVTVYTDEDAQNQYAGCKVKHTTATVNLVDEYNP